MRTESPATSVSFRHLDDIALDDAAFRVLAAVQAGQAALPPSLASVSPAGRAQARLQRCVPAGASPAVIAALGRAAVADAVVCVLAAPVRFADVELHASWSAGAADANGPAVAAAATRALAEYGAEIGLAHVVTGEVLKPSAAPRGWALRAEAALAAAAAPLPFALDSVSDSLLVLVDLADGRYRVQGGALARAYEAVDEVSAENVPESVPDGAAEDHVTAFAAALAELRAQGRVLAYGARSSGGLFTCVAGMALAGQVGVALNIDLLVIDGDGVSDGRMDSGEVKNWTQQISGRRAEHTLRALFAEEAGAVLQVRRADCAAVMATLRAHGLSKYSNFIGATRPADAASDQGKGELTIWRDATQVFGAPLAELAQADPARRAAARAPRQAAPAAPKEMTHEEKIKAMRMGMWAGRRGPRAAASAMRQCADSPSFSCRRHGRRSWRFFHEHHACSRRRDRRRRRHALSRAGRHQLFALPQRHDPVVDPGDLPDLEG